jgi:hypothetical protein
MSTGRPRAYPGYTTNRQHPSRQTSDGDPAETWPAYLRHCELACRALMVRPTGQPAQFAGLGIAEPDHDLAELR